MISESGGAERVWTRSNSALVANGFGKEWKTRGNDVLAMRTCPAESLIEAQRVFFETWPQHFPLRAEIDGTFVPQLPVKTIAAGSTRGKRLLIGTNKEESAAFIGPHPAHDAAAKDLGNLPLEKFAAVYRHYGELYPQLSPEQLCIRAVTAEEYWIPSMRVLDAHVRGGGKAWAYRLDFVESSGRLRNYAYHSLDIPLVWDRPHAEIGNEPAEASLAAQVHAAWVGFIRGDSPAAAGLPEWPEYRSDTRPTMILDRESRVEQRPFEAEMRLWDGVL
jgi:para-nitrobenzyl esterase